MPTTHPIALTSADLLLIRRALAARVTDRFEGAEASALLKRLPQGFITVISQAA